jgi:hypothetical protein
MLLAGAGWSNNIMKGACWVRYDALKIISKPVDVDAPYRTKKEPSSNVTRSNVLA